MGQVRPVRIINFVAKGTIEEGMLSVLAFKRSLSAGILDGGIGEISLGGSRLNRFMKDVESVTGNLGGSEPVTPAEEVGAISVADQAELEQHAKSDGDVGPSALALPSTGGSQPSGDPWQALLQIGAQFAGALAAVGSPGTAAHPWIERDPATGGQSSRSRCLRRKSPSNSPMCSSRWQRACVAEQCSTFQVACQSSPSTQVTPVTKRLDSMVRRTAPVCTTCQRFGSASCAVGVMHKFLQKKQAPLIVN